MGIKEGSQSDPAMARSFPTTGVCMASPQGRRRSKQGQSSIAHRRCVGHVQECGGTAGGHRARPGDRTAQ